jgi:geranylgeranyl diphosphate synthase type I
MPATKLRDSRVGTPTSLVETVEELMDQLVSGNGPAATMCREHLDTGGKRIRARLALQTVSALGGEARRAVPWAAACELIHNASLVHDDLQDGDRVRRGVPALWARHGAAQAISVGDLMLMLPTVALEHLDVDDGTRWALARLVAVHGAATARGQSAELALKGRVRVTAADYEAAAVGKTAGLFGMPVEGGARIAGRDAATARALAHPFERLGLMYQMQDDVIDLYGDKGRNEVGTDIREGKISALVAAHVELNPEDRLWLNEILARPREQTSPEAVREVSQRFVDSGALDAVLSRIRQLSEEMATPELRAEPVLYAVAEQLRARILAPLRGLL